MYIYISSDTHIWIPAGAAEFSRPMAGDWNTYGYIVCKYWKQILNKILNRHFRFLGAVYVCGKFLMNLASLNKMFSPQVIDWLNNHGDVFLKKNTSIGKSLQRAKALQKSHEHFESVARVSIITVGNVGFVVVDTMVPGLAHFGPLLYYDACECSSLPVLHASVHSKLLYQEDIMCF